MARLPQKRANMRTTAWTFLGPALLALGAGASFVTQSALNAQLRTVLHSPVRASFVSYLGGTITMAVLALAMRESMGVCATTSLLARGGCGRAASSERSTSSSRSSCSHASARRHSSPRSSRGQMFASLAFDQFGWFGLTPRPIDLTRVLRRVLLVGGVVLISPLEPQGSRARVEAS